MSMIFPLRGLFTIINLAFLVGFIYFFVKIILSLSSLCNSNKRIEEKLDKIIQNQHEFITKLKDE